MQISEAEQGRRAAQSVRDRQTFRDRREAADYLTRVRGLRTSWRTLQKMATVGGGPAYRIYGNKAVYTDQDLDDWADAKLSPLRRSTSEAA